MPNAVNDFLINKCFQTEDVSFSFTMAYCEDTWEPKIAMSICNKMDDEKLRDTIASHFFDQQISLSLDAETPIHCGNINGQAFIKEREQDFAVRLNVSCGEKHYEGIAVTFPRE